MQLLSGPSLHKPIQVLRYMGNKTKILDFIVKRVVAETQPYDLVLDMMSGTNAVGYALKGRYRVYTNDIQEYSYVISKALVENNTYLQVPQEDIDKLMELMDANMRELNKIADHIKKNQFDSSKKNHIVHEYRNDPQRHPYCLFSYYFADKYFTLRNCMVIDSLRYAIDRLTENDRTIYRRCVLLTCLLYAISMTVHSTGHFAQYRTKGEDLKKIKKRAVEYEFIQKAKSLDIRSNGKENRTFCTDYRELLTNPKYKHMLADVDVVYFDPPYSPEHYSRFYHIPETLVKYDYPECEFKGRYRQGRHLSNFGQIQKAHEEFEFAVKHIAQLNNKVKLMISYSRSSTSILTVRQMMRICKKHFAVVGRPYEIDYKHSSSGKKKGSVKEILLVCKAPKSPAK